MPEDRTSSKPLTEAADLPNAWQCGRVLKSTVTGKTYLDNGSEWEELFAELTVATKTGHYTLTDDDDLILVDCSGGSRTITLQAVATAKQKPYYIKKIDSSGNAMVIDGNASETIDGAANVSTTVQYTSYTLIPNNAGGWNIV